MRKALSYVLALVLVFSAFTTVFAAEATPTVPTDVKGTNYETAVTNLLNKGIVSGYPDGTFNPAGTINRAEACIMVVKSMNPSDADLKAAKDSGFTDLSGYGWAASYINYAAAKGIVSGYGNGLFKPAGNVTYNEMSAMLVNAQGVKTSDLTGTWPANYYNKAVALGVYTSMEMASVDAANKAAIRGDVAVMTNNSVDKIAEANKTPETPSTSEPAVKPTDSGITTKPAVTDSEYEKLNGKMATFSGNAYGLIIDVATVTGKDGDSVDQIEFLMGNQTYYLNTNKKGITPTSTNDGQVYQLKMTNGIVKDIYKPGEGKASSTFIEYTASTTYQEVASRSGSVLTMTGSALVSGISNPVTIIDGASIYKETSDGYEKASLSSIKAGTKVRLYHTTKEDSGIVEVVVIEK